jgi:hypothetical protein
MYIELKRALPLIPTTLVLFKAYSLLPLFGIRFTIKVLKWQRGLVHIANIAELESTNSWKGRSLSFPTIRARENRCHTTVVLKPLLDHKSKLFRGLLSSFCAVVKRDTLSSEEPLKLGIREFKTKVLLASCFRVLNRMVRV